MNSGWEHLEKANVAFWGDCSSRLVEFLLRQSISVANQGGFDVNFIRFTSIEKPGKLTHRRFSTLQQALNLMGDVVSSDRFVGAFLMGDRRPSVEEDHANRAYFIGDVQAGRYYKSAGFSGGMAWEARTRDFVDHDGVMHAARSEAACSYAFATRWPYLWSPACFIDGTTVIPPKPLPAPDDALNHRVNRWRIELQDGATFKEGFLRDVYEENWINQNQLDCVVHGTTLASWIKEGPERGELTPTTWGLSKWTVKTEHLSAIRQSLDAEGLLLAGRGISST